MTRFRKDRVAELLLQAISEMVVLKIKDPRVQGITITEVRMSGDLKSASVYFSSLTDGKADDHKRAWRRPLGTLDASSGRNWTSNIYPSFHSSMTHHLTTSPTSTSC